MGSTVYTTPLYLPEGDPIEDHEAVNKQYVDQHGSDEETLNESLYPVEVRRGVRSAVVVWTASDLVHGHGYYEVELHDNSSFTSLVDSQHARANIASFSDLRRTTNYYARVRAVGADGEPGPWFFPGMDDPNENGGGGGGTPDSFIPDQAADEDISHLNATKITAGIITAIRYRTSASGQRVEIDDDAVYFYNGNGTLVGVIYGDATAAGNVVYISGKVEIDNGIETSGAISWGSGHLHGSGGQSSFNGPVIVFSHFDVTGNAVIDGSLDVHGSKNAVIIDPEDERKGYKFAAIEADEPGLLLHRTTVEVTSGSEATKPLPEHWSRIAQDGDAWAVPTEEGRSVFPVASVDLSAPAVTVKAPPGIYRVFVMAARADISDWQHEVIYEQ